MAGVWEFCGVILKFFIIATMLLGPYSALVNQSSLHWTHLGCLNSNSAVNTPGPLTVFRDDYFHWLTEGSNAPFSDDRDSHYAGGIVDLDRNLSPAAILADFFRQFFLETEKRKGNETLIDSGRWLTRQLPTLPTVPLREATHSPCTEVMFPQSSFFTGPLPVTLQGGSRG